MRIGMMADIYKPHVSGVTMYISLNKHFLEQAGHEVFIFTFGDPDYPDEDSNVIRSPGVPLGGGLRFTVRHTPAAQRLLKTMDILHVNHPIISGHLALLYSRRYGLPLVFTNHSRYDLYIHLYVPAVPDIIGETLIRTILPPFCKACDLVIAPSHGIQRVLKDFGVDSNVMVIPNGVDIAAFQAPAEAVSRAELGFNEESVVLTYMGRLGPEKNLPFLLRAFGSVVEACENTGLLIIGDGPVRDELEDRVRLMGLQEQVRFTGLIPYEQLPGYLATADAFVTASITEVHPLSLIESMATGLPVLGIRSPGVEDLVEDGVTGLLAADQDLSLFTEKMLQLVRDSAQRREMAANARKAAQGYSIENTGRTLLEQYERLLAGEGRKKRRPRPRKPLIARNAR